MKTAAVTALLLLFANFFAVAAHAERRDIDFNAADGFTLKGTFYSIDKPGPGVLLLQACEGDRHVYDHLAGMLNTAGYNVLSFDLRGFGESRAGEYADFAAQRQKIMDRMPGDIDAALSLLTSQSTVNPRALGIVASDCSVNQAVHAARRHAEIRTLVAFSGGTDAEGEAYLKDSPKITVLGIASDEDSSAAAIKKLVASSASHDSQVEMLSGAGHAAAIFAKQPDVEPDIVIWFRSNLPPAGYGLPPAIK
jgi:dienelactone hydrolase